MKPILTQVKVYVFFLLSSLFYLNSFAQVNSLPFTEAFNVGYSSDFYHSAGTANAGSTDACTTGNYVGVITSSSYLTTKTYSVPQGNGLQISFQLKNSGSYTCDVYIRVNDAITFSQFNTGDDDWVKIGSATTSACGTNTFNVGSDIVGGQRVSVTINFASVSSFVAIDNLSLTAATGSTVQTTYTEDFSNNAWYNTSNYVKIPYHSNNSETNSYAYLFNGGVGGFSDYYAALTPGFDISEGTNIITEEVNTSGYAHGELNFEFLSQYPCGGPTSYTVSENYDFFTTNVYIMKGADNGTNSWVQLPVNYYFPDATWHSASVDISAYNNSNIKIMFVEESQCSTPDEGIDNIQILDRNCTISKLTCGAITGTTSPSANTNYNYSVAATTGAGYYLWMVRNGGTIYQSTPYIVSGQGTQNVTVNFGSLTGARLICIPYDANPSTNTDACYATLGYVDMSSCTAPVVTSADTVSPTTCGGTNGSIQLLGLTASTTYALTYNANGTPVSSANYTTDANGTLAVTGLTAGSYNNFIVTLSGCSSSAYPASGALVLTNPATGAVSTPVFNIGATSSRCEGAGTITYTATSSNSTGITYTLDATSLNAGNTINSNTGAVTYAANYSGTAVITASAAGCGGPLTATHTVTISTGQGIPVFNLGATSSRCVGAGNVTYTATSTNSTNIKYILDATSLNAGNTIDSTTGTVTYTSLYTGTATITAIASGCGGPVSTANHTVTISPSVSTPVFTGGNTSTRCQATGSVTYTATANNSTGITYSLDNTSLNAGNSIVSGTGAVTWSANYNGTATVTASATGCNGPVTATVTVTVTPAVSAPIFNIGSTSTRCQGAGSVTYTATASNSTGITYSLDEASLNAGNTINSATGEVTYTANYTGTTIITASATGCSGPANSTHTVTISAATGTPVFNIGSTATRCQGTGTVMYIATASNSTGIGYSLDATSLNAGNTINSNTGAVTWTANYNGTATVTATASGCGNPTTATLTIAITPPVGTPVFNNGDTVLRCEGAGASSYTATATNSTGITYSLDNASTLAGNSINSANGTITWSTSYTGTATVTASATGCGGPTTSTLTINITGVTGTPVFALGNSSSRCEGATTVTYSATATNSTGITYSLDPTSLSGGNTINAATGAVTYAANYTGTAVITALASGCGQSTSATHIVTITAPVGTPVFNGGNTASRCKGAGIVSYAATAANNTRITYSLDATSLNGGNTIDSTTGSVTWSASYTGAATITATASGCGGPTIATLVITINPPTGTPVFVDGNTITRCQGAGIVTYTANASNTTGITYSLDVPSQAAGNTINPANGQVTWVANYSGTATVTASAAGCGNPAVSTLTVIVTPSVGTPLFSTSNSSSARCSGTTTTVNYSASATNSTGITYKLDSASVVAGNTIDTITGNVTWAANFSGTATITATATGCNGPVSNSIQILFSQPATTPVFNIGNTSIRCQGAGAVTYTATATNSQGILYRLDGVSTTAGNVIDSTTGQVTWTAGYSGTATITAIAIGCGYPAANLTVTINPSVHTPAFLMGPASTRCVAAGTVVYSAIATDSTGISYSLDATSLNASNTINASTGAVTWTSGYSGTAIITVTATGCNGPLTATHTVTITNAAVGTPVFSQGDSASRCSGSSTTTYSATVNNGSITYSLDAASLLAGNTIDSVTGAVTWISGYTGRAIITATATGCGGPTSATYVVNISNGSTPTIHITATPGNTICSGDTVKFNATISNGGNAPGYLWQKNLLPVGSDTSYYTDYALAQGDVITCILTSNAKCLSQSTGTANGITMTVNPKPSAPILSVLTPLCAGDNIQLNCQQVSNASYSWTGPQRFISAQQNPVLTDVDTSNSGTYYATVTVNGCTSPTSNVTVLVKPTPATPSVSQSGDTLISTPANTYQWFKSSVAITGATLRKYVATQSGLYSVQVTDTNGCSATSVQYNITLLGLSDITTAPVFTIYPNPLSSGSWLLSVNDVLLGSTVEIYDATGRLVYTSSIRDIQSDIPANVAPGIYLLNIISDEKSVGIKKLVKL